MDDGLEVRPGPSIRIKFITKDDSERFRTKGDHMQIVPPRMRLACFHCGYWVSPHPQSSSTGISTRMYKAITKAFMADHRHCRPRPEGREAYIELKREWDKFMAEYDGEREQWEKDHDKKWARSDWGAIYDAWINLPFERKGRRQ